MLNRLVSLLLTPLISTVIATSTIVTYHQLVVAEPTKQEAKEFQAQLISDNNALLSTFSYRVSMLNLLFKSQPETYNTLIGNLVTDWDSIKGNLLLSVGYESVDKAIEQHKLIIKNKQAIKKFASSKNYERMVEPHHELNLAYIRVSVMHVNNFLREVEK